MLEDEALQSVFIERVTGLKNRRYQIMLLVLVACLLAGSVFSAEKAEESVLEMPTASGVLTKKSGKATIDYSNTEDGYVMVNYSAETAKRLKVQIKGPATTYTYNLTPGQWEVFPLTEGDGSYQAVVYENISGTRYSTLVSAKFKVALKDEFVPFLQPNQFVNYTAAPNTVAKAAEVMQGKANTLDKVKAVYDYVISSLTYDNYLAATVQSGYVPDLDAVLEKKTGICFDYAAVMTGMLRSQGVPCKMVFGYVDTMYHAWISVWMEETGWVDAIYFDGTSWKQMDPTFASSALHSGVGNKDVSSGLVYTTKYQY